MDVIVKAAGVCCLGSRLSCKVLWETLGTYPSWAGGGQLVERLGQQDLGVAHGVSDGVVLLLASEGQLGEGRLVARGVLDVDEVLVVGRAVVLGQLEEPDEGLEQRGPGGERTTDTLVTHGPRWCTILRQ